MEGLVPDLLSLYLQIPLGKPVRLSQFHWTHFGSKYGGPKGSINGWLCQLFKNDFPGFTLRPGNSSAHKFRVTFVSSRRYGIESAYCWSEC